MFLRFCAIIFVGALLEWKPTHSAPAEVGKPKGKGRAYEFGFSIQEQQHRHEKRDENGIVMGEFGFITADGIYHVTVYATDENGKFKILAMKSYPYADPEKKMMIAMLPPPKKPVVMPTFKKATPLDTPSCSGCVLTKKLSPADVVEQVPGNPEGVFRPLSKTFNDAGVTTKNVPSPSLQSRPSPPRLPSLPPPPVKPNTIGSTPSKATPGAAANGKQYPLTTFRTPGPAIQPLPQIPTNRQAKTSSPSIRPQVDVRFGSAPTQPNQLPSQKPAFASTNFNQPQGQQTPQNTFTPNTATVVSHNAKEPPAIQPFNKFLPNVGGPAQPPLTQNSIQPQSKNTLSPRTGGSPAPGSGSQQYTSNKALTQTQLINNYTPTGTQLPSTNGVRTPTAQLPSTGKLTPSSQSIGKATPSGSGGGPLYRFKYVLDYNSHREEGRIDGSKEGNYQTVEDGIRRIIDYIANENGYQPHIKWERVPPNELPTGENKLKDYEFVWFN